MPFERIVAATDFSAASARGQASDAAVAHYRERARSRAERELERFCAELGPVAAPPRCSAASRPTSR